jgi:hypothetical protein
MDLCTRLIKRSQVEDFAAGRQVNRVRDEGPRINRHAHRSISRESGTGVAPPRLPPTRTRPIGRKFAPRGRLIVVGAGSDPIEVSPLQLLFGSRSVEEALTGSAIDNEDTLAFSALQNVRGPNPDGHRDGRIGPRPRLPILPSLPLSAALVQSGAARYDTGGDDQRDTQCWKCSTCPTARDTSGARLPQAAQAISARCSAVVRRAPVP